MTEMSVYFDTANDLMMINNQFEPDFARKEKRRKNLWIGTLLLYERNSFDDLNQFCVSQYVTHLKWFAEFTQVKKRESAVGFGLSPESELSFFCADLLFSYSIQFDGSNSKHNIWRGR